MAVKIRTRVSTNGKKRHTSLYQTPSGKWLSAGTFGDKQQAMRAALGHEREAQTPGWVDPGKGDVTLRSYALEVWEPSLTLAETTKAEYGHKLRLHILPVFGDSALDKILASQVQTWVNTKIKEGAAPSSVHQMHTVLSRILDLAMRDEIINRNPCRLIRRPPITKPEVKILSPEQYSAVIEHVPDHYLGVVMTGIETGMRLSELRGLCPAQINFFERVINVDRAVVEVSLDGRSQFIHKPYPKSNRPRRIKVNTATIERLSVAIERRGLGAKSTEPIFATEKGHYLRSKRLWDALNLACTAAGVERRTMKHLRSSHASWLLAGGADVETVRQRLGHQSITTTQKYLSVLPEHEEKALAAFEAVSTRSARG